MPASLVLAFNSTHCLALGDRLSAPVCISKQPCPFPRHSVFLFGPGYVPFSEKAMAPHSSTFAWKIPWMEEPGGLQSMGSLKVGHD